MLSLILIEALIMVLALKCLNKKRKKGREKTYFVFHSLLSLQYSPVTVVGVGVVVIVIVVTSCEMSLSKSLLELLCY